MVETAFHPILNIMIKASNSSLFQYRTVKELLWGYKDPMLKNNMGLFLDVSKQIFYPYLQINSHRGDPHSGTSEMS